MKKILIVIVGVVFLTVPALCFAAYVIHLKDGRKIVTNQYWEEGTQIKFKRFGGVMGFQKDLVKEIEEKEDLPEEKAEVVKPGTPSAAGTADDAKKAEVPGAVEKVKSAEQEKSDKIEAFLEEKREIAEERRSASEAFKEAKAKNDKAATKKHFQRLVSLREKNRKLKKKVKAEFGGRLPDWWQE